MNENRWPRAKELLYQAMQLAPDLRGSFLDAACGDDDPMRAEVESLLAVTGELEPEFLSSPHDRKVPPARPESHPSLEMQEGELFAGRFRLVRSLGEGGMGQVWLAEQTTPVRRQVALKLIRAGMYDATVAQRFEAERQSLAMMQHPSIAKVFEAGSTPQGQPYFVMEYVPGVPITEYCDQHRLGIEARIALMIQACEGVQHAHQKAVIHRDLKPANILVADVDGKPVPRIIDFGLARPVARARPDQDHLTRAGLLIGTPGYISPEQIDLRITDIDTRTDVYSLGVILYVLLTGLQPFEERRRERPPLDQWLRQLREDEAPLASAKLSSDREALPNTAAQRATRAGLLRKQLRGDLDCIAMKALERDRARRYATPSELAADLRRYLQHEPVIARPAGGFYQLGKFMRRYRSVAVAAGLVTVLAVAATAAAVFAFAKERESQFQAAQALRAQTRLLTQAAAQRVRDYDLAGAQGIILAVLTNPAFAPLRTPAAISTFQEIRAADAQIAILSGHRGYVNSAAYSPDGTRIVTSSDDKTAGIFDAASGMLLRVLAGHEGYVNSAAYSPDGSRVVTASDDKTARIFDAATGKQIAVLSGHGDVLNSVIYSPDGNQILTGSDDRTARIWDAHSGVLQKVLAGHDKYVYSAAYSPDGTRIVTASADKTARIWDARTGAQLLVLSGHAGYLDTAAYSPDGRHILTTSGDKTARIWDAVTGVQLVVLAGHGGPIYSAAYSPDGQHIVTGSRDRTARIWDAVTGAQLAVLSGHGDRVACVSYSPDGSRILTASFDQTARIWDAHPAKQQLLLRGHAGAVNFASYSSDGARVVTASSDTTARVWDARTGAPVTVLRGHGDRVLEAVYSPDGASIATASNDKTARIWNAESGALRSVLPNESGYVTAAAYSPDGRQLVTASTDKSAHIFDLASGKERTVLSGHSGYVYSAAFSPDGAELITGSADSTAKLWDLRTGAPLRVLTGHHDRVNFAAYSPDGLRIVTASGDKTARIWDARSGATVLVLAGHTDRVQSAAYSHDGAYVVTTSYDKTARLWDARSGTQLAVFAGHGDGVLSAVFSPDDKHILTASADTTARIWDATIPASLDAQIRWDAAAESDPLSELDRTLLGIPADPSVRSFSATASTCDQGAAAVYDPDRSSAGVLDDKIDVNTAVPACAAEILEPRHAARADYQMGRALRAKGDLDGALREFENAAAQGYRTARVDTADLLLDEHRTYFDPQRAMHLYTEAWNDGVEVAAARLGRLYETGADGPAPAEAAQHIAKDPAKAADWYRRGAERGEPNALAHGAELTERNALALSEPAARNAAWLAAFKLYAAAAGRAARESWPDDAWKHWRYRRATLARLLAAAGMMQPVADAYSHELAAAGEK